MRLLPEAYARALALRDEGCDAMVIARELQMPIESVPLLLRIAEAKLARLVASQPSPHAAKAGH